MSFAPRATPAPGRASELSLLLLLVLLYTGLTAWLAWPLPRLAGTHLPFTSPTCTFDPLCATWILSYESHALATAPLEFANGNIYFPAQRAIFYGPAGLGTLPYFAPVFLLTGNPALAMNVTFLACTALAALGLHWVMQRWTGWHAAGLVAGMTLLTSPWILRGTVSTAANLSALHLFPLILFLAAPQLRTPLHWVVLLFLVTLQCLTDVVYVAPAVLAPLGVLAAARIVRREWRASGLRLAALLLAAAALLSPVYAIYLSVRRANPGVAHQTLWSQREPPLDLASLFWHAGSPATVAPAALVILLVGFALALRRWRRDRSLADAPAWRHGALWLGVGVLISLTPIVQWDGRDLPSPQQLLDRWTPLYRIVRTPSRLGIAALFGLCVLSGAGASQIARWSEEHLGAARRRAIEVGLAVLAAIALYLVAPAGSVSLRQPYPVRAVPQVPAAFLPYLTADGAPLLHLPTRQTALDPRFTMARLAARAMFQSLFHWRPLLNGYTSFWPAGFLERMALADQLPRASALRQLVRETGLALVWVSLGDLEPAARASWSAVAAAGSGPGGLELLAREKGELLFGVRAPQQQSKSRRPGRPLAVGVATLALGPA